MSTHDWIKSTLGHGEVMCKHCYITNREAAVLGLLDECDVAPTEPAKLDPRDPDPSREGIFRDHNCYRCNSGAKPCVNGSPSRCEYPHARND